MKKYDAGEEREALANKLAWGMSDYQSFHRRVRTLARVLRISPEAVEKQLSSDAKLIRLEAKEH